MGDGTQDRGDEASGHGDLKPDIWSERTFPYWKRVGETIKQQAEKQHSLPFDCPGATR